MPVNLSFLFWDDFCKYLKFAMYHSGQHVGQKTVTNKRFKQSKESKLFCDCQLSLNLNCLIAVNATHLVFKEG